MSDPIVPDDLARSKSGRVPQWVIDEAKGLKTEPVPFRAAPTQTATKPPRDSRRMGWLRVGLTVAIVAAVVAVGAKTGFGTSGIPGTSQARRDAPPPGLGEKGHPLGTPQPVVLASNAYKIGDFQDDGKTPVTWSPCRPIHYVVRPDNAPPDGDRMITDAIARLSTVTGFRFEYDGTTTEKPLTRRSAYQKSRYGDQWAPVLLAWATPDEIGDFGDDIEGLGGADAVRTPSGDYAYVTGFVYLDPHQLGEDARRHGEAQGESTILHELGHLMGLDHTKDRGQIMFRSERLGVTQYQPGDLAGLNVLSTGPCQKDI